jgi:hypothetical protein
MRCCVSFLTLVRLVVVVDFAVVRLAGVGRRVVVDLVVVDFMGR